MADKCTAAAAVRLMMFYPFWCELFYSMKIVEDESVPTLATDGSSMWVNPKFWAGLTLDYKIAALAHEVCHKMLHHCTRGLGFDRYWGNIAMDIVVNTMLAKNGFKIAPTWVQPHPQYEGWTFEAVYKEITKNLPPPPKQPKGGQGSEEGQGGGMPGNVPSEYQGAWMDVKRFKGTPAEMENFEQKIEAEVAKAVATAKAMGHTPAGVEMAMDKVAFRSEEKWYDHLSRYFQSLCMAEYNWSRMNKRLAAVFRIVAPDVYSERLGEVVILRDTSGSCYSAAEQAHFNSHINTILLEAKPKKVHVVDFDVIVHAHREVDPGEIEFDAPPVGGGGTSFRHLFSWIEDQGIEPAVVIVLTDMCGSMPDANDAPSYPVLWCSTTTGYNGPFGETIEIK